MPQTPALLPAEIRARRMENPKLRDRELACSLGISEAELVAAHTGARAASAAHTGSPAASAAHTGPGAASAAADGQTATRIAAHPDLLMPAVAAMGEVMALTRNASCVHEKVGRYDDYRSGDHAAMVLNAEIDLRIFPAHWRHAFAVEKETDRGTSRSIQVFDAAGDAVHKVFLRDGSDLQAWDRMVPALAVPDQSDTLSVAARQPVEGARANPDKRDVLLKEWARMTDTHQFLRLTSKLKMNRLGAYRIAGAPWVRPLAAGAVDAMLGAVQAGGVEVMVFVGNRGCIQIHSGRVRTLRPMGPWQNVMDPGFNLHLRLDHIAEVWAVEKPTSRGPAISVEAFDAEGGLILQVFPRAKEGNDHRRAWAALVADLPGLEAEVA